MGEKIYLIADINWEYNDVWYDPVDSEPVKAFRDKNYAEMYMYELEQEARKQTPVSFFAKRLELVTSLTEEQFLNRLKELYLPEPQRYAGKFYNLQEWWRDVVVEQLTPSKAEVRASWVSSAPDDQQNRLMQVTMQDVWELFDKIRFYRLVEVTIGEHGTLQP